MIILLAVNTYFFFNTVVQELFSSADFISLAKLKYFGTTVTNIRIHE
jgi:hypothetical protein